MNTKRCPNCHKLQRASTQVCRGCGHVFIKPKPSTPDANVALTNPLLPPASPHRAGHYSGLHPEDQPYISSKIAVHYPPPSEADRRYWAQTEPHSIIFPATSALPAIKVLREQIATRSTHTEQPGSYHYERQGRQEHQEPITHPPVVSRKTLLSQGTIIALLIISGIFLLVASSIIAFVLLHIK